MIEEILLCVKIESSDDEQILFFFSSSSSSLPPSHLIDGVCVFYALEEYFFQNIISIKYAESLSHDAINWLLS